MSKIVYKPHCEQCGALIEQKIQYKRNMLDVSDTIHLIYRYTSAEYYDFNPCRCKNCGALFDSAEVQLPEEVEYF